jgi:hypothetical protein
MVKTGKIFPAVLIIGVFFVLPAAAQQQQPQQEWTRSELQNIYIDYLRQEGYLPSIDADGDILFKVSGNSYFIIVDENDLQFFQIYMGFSLGAVSTEDALNAANYSNRRSKVAKVSISSDGRVANITAELLLNNPRDFMPVLSRALSLMRNAENNFITQLRTPT